VTKHGSGGAEKWTCVSPCLEIACLPSSVAPWKPLKLTNSCLSLGSEQGLTLVHFQLNLSRFCHTSPCPPV